MVFVETCKIDIVITLHEAECEIGTLISLQETTWDKDFGIWLD